MDVGVEPLTERGYIYYERYNSDMPYRRFFVRLKDFAQSPETPQLIGSSTQIPVHLANHSNRLAHIHLMVVGSEHWTRHIAFRDYLRSHPSVREAYQELKEGLSKQQWRDGNHYNEAKDEFMELYEAKAVEWYWEKKR